MTCPNCGASLTCGCQKRTASNGTPCCVHCVGNYEKTIKKSSSTNQNLLTNPNKGPRPLNEPDYSTHTYSPTFDITPVILAANLI